MFEKAFIEVIGHEGEFTNDPNDKGNWTSGIVGKGELRGTKYGISAASYPDVKIQTLSIEGVKDIYHTDFWKKANIDKLPKHLQVSVFDSVVNHGIKGGIRILQRALNIKNDGIVGPITIKASKKLLEAKFLLYRLNFYIDLILKKPELTKYINGWRNRIIKLLNDKL